MKRVLVLLLCFCILLSSCEHRRSIVVDLENGPLTAYYQIRTPRQTGAQESFIYSGTVEQIQNGAMNDIKDFTEKLDGSSAANAVGSAQKYWVKRYHKAFENNVVVLNRKADAWVVMSNEYYGRKAPTFFDGIIVTVIERKTGKILYSICTYKR